MAAQCAMVQPVLRCSFAQVLAVLRCMFSCLCSELSALCAYHLHSEMRLASQHSAVGAEVQLPILVWGPSAMQDSVQIRPQRSECIALLLRLLIWFSFACFSQMTRAAHLRWARCEAISAARLGCEQALFAERHSRAACSSFFIDSNGCVCLVPEVRQGRIAAAVWASTWD
jgi:hypothetical protein